MGTYIFLGGEGNVEGANRITKTGAPGVRVVGASDPERPARVQREKKALATGGPSSALGSELGNLFTFLNPKFPHL